MALVLVFLILLLIILVDICVLYGIFQSLLVEYQLVFQVFEVVVRKVESFPTGKMTGRRKERVQAQSERILQHRRNDSFQNRTVDLEAGIVIYL